MKYWTWAEIREKIEDDLGLQQEDFVSESELRGYANSGIDEAEAEIFNLFEDYFLDRYQASLVAGQANYPLPSTIYASKIRSVIYNNGNDLYLVRRMRFSNKFLDIEITNRDNTSLYYRYFLLNSTAGSQELNLVPPARDNVTNGLTIWFIRNANRLEADADVCDIPEFIEFIFEHMRMKVYLKEGNPSYQASIVKLEQLRKQMRETLSALVADEDNELEKDWTFYEETV